MYEEIYTKKCKYCMSDIDIDAKICPICKKRQSKKKIYIIIISIVLALLITLITIIAVNDYNKASRLTANVSLYNEFNKFITKYISDGVILENIGNDIKSYWHDSIWEDKYNSDIDTAISQALKDNKENVQIALENKNSMSNIYNKIKHSECYSIYCDEVKDTVEKAYNYYLDFYTIATSPTGNYNSYTSDFASIDSNVVKSYNDMRDLIKLFANSYLDKE